MTDSRPTPKRFRPRFSVRTLVVLVTLVCVALALWLATDDLGVAGVTNEAKRRNRIVISGGTVMPLLVRTVEDDTPAETLEEMLQVSQDGPVIVTGIRYVSPPKRRYYFWFFGYVAKLPYERELPFSALTKTPGRSAGFHLRVPPSPSPPPTD